MKSDIMASQGNSLKAGASSRTALVVLGMHRSGTSAMSGVLAQMGCDLPKELMPPTDANPKGYFESNKAYRLNDDLLASAGSAWDDSTAFNPDWYGSPRYPEYGQRAAKVIEEEFGASGFFVLKDPRICRLLPFWQQVLADLDVGPRYVCIHRHPREVAASLTRREGWSETVGLLLWLRHVIEAEAGSRGKPRSFVSYDMLMADWRGTVARIGNELELNWPRHPDNAASDVEEFLSGELRHFRAASEQMPQHSLAFGWVARAYEVLERWAAHGEQAADHAEFDALKAAFDEASPLLGLVALENRRLEAKLAKAETTLTAARAESIGHAANHATEQRSRSAAEGLVANLEAELAATAKSRRELENDLAQTRSAFLQRGHELDELRQQTERDTLRIARLSSELETLRDELEHFEQRHERDARHLAQMARQLAPLIRQEFGAVIDSKRADETAARLEREKAELALSKTLLETRYLAISEEVSRVRESAATEITALRVELEALKPLEEKVETATRALEQKVAELEAFRQAIKTSTSWRLTAPLRGLSRLLKGR
ncbi:MAG: sulfotransferase [Pseudomonadota bacterium]